jgi:hypothetical protein
LFINVSTIKASAPTVAIAAISFFMILLAIKNV